MKLVNQPSALPTNKLGVAALVGPAVAEVWRNLMTDAYPALAGDATAILVGTFAALIAGYFVRDRANVEVQK